MAANLVAAGHTRARFRPGAALRRSGRRARAPQCSTVAQTAVADADVVITSLPNGDIVKACYAEVLPAAKAGALFIDTSTISVDDARDHQRAGRRTRFRTTRRPGVRRGQGCNRRARWRSWSAATMPRSSGPGRCWNPWRARSFTAAASGAGQAAKLCNNMVLAVQQIAIGEAFVLAEKLGLSAQSLFDVITGATGNCWAVHTNCPVPGPVPTSPANNDFKPGFATALMNKDLGLAMDAVNSTGSSGAAGQPRRGDLRQVRSRPRRQGLQRRHRTCYAADRVLLPPTNARAGVGNSRAVAVRRRCNPRGPPRRPGKSRA